MKYKKYRLNTGGYGRITIKVPKKIKGRKITPSVYKVRTNSRGRDYAIVGLYTGTGRNIRVYKNKKVYLKRR